MRLTARPFDGTLEEHLPLRRTYPSRVRAVGDLKSLANRRVMGTDTSKSLFDQAMKEIMATNYVAAELMLTQAAELNEEDTTLYAASLAVLLAYRQRADEAIKLLEERLDAHSNDPNLLLAYGLTLEKQEKFEDAEDAFKEVLAEDPDNAGALRGISSRLQARGELEEAARLAVKAFTQVPDNLIYAKTAGDLLELTNRPSAAFDVIELGAHYNPEDEELVSRAFQGCLQNNYRDRARELLDLLDETQGWAAAWKLAIYDWLGLPDRSEALLARTLERPAGKESPFLFQAALHALRREDPYTADLYLARILEKNPQHTGALRLRAELSLGRTDYDAAIDPLMKAFALSSDSLTGWQLFWSCIASDRLEEAEEVLSALAEDEESLHDPAEAARLELAENLLLAVQDALTDSPQHPNLEVLPDDLACGLLLEFLDALSEAKLLSGNTLELNESWLQELGRRDPVLNLNRLYSRGDWDQLRNSLEHLLRALEDPDLPMDPLQVGSIYRLYNLLLALATEDAERLGNIDENLPPDLKEAVIGILGQKDRRNSTEQRWLDRLDVELVKEDLPPDIIEPQEAGAPPPMSGQILNVQEVEVIYETEDGEILTDLNEEDYEIIEEVEVDPDDDEYEWVWVEEVIEEEVPVEAPEDTYRG